MFTKFFFPKFNVLNWFSFIFGVLFRFWQYKDQKFNWKGQHFFHISTVCSGSHRTHWEVCRRKLEMVLSLLDIYQQSWRIDRFEMVLHQANPLFFFCFRFVNYNHSKQKGKISVRNIIPNYPKLHQKRIGPLNRIIFLFFQIKIEILKEFEELFTTLKTHFFLVWVGYISMSTILTGNSTKVILVFPTAILFSMELKWTLDLIVQMFKVKMLFSGSTHFAE